jgi:outer membrane receptor protein involved in Fe transport
VNPLDADGNYVFLDPLSASFGGFSGGNPNLMEESAETITYGFVWQPSFLEGFSLTADYWEIVIEDAIQSVSSQDIVDGCYRGASLNQNFCGNFTRNTDSNSPQFGGFNFLRTSDINFAKLETSGYDLAASYTFDVGEHSFRLNGNATKVNELDQFTNPADLNDLNPELREIQRPEWAGSVALSWGWRDLTVGINSQYLGEMLEGGLEIETALDLYAPSVLLEETWIHNLNASYTISDSIDIYGGVRNITQEKPFITRNAFPVSPRGRQIFIGGTYRL